MAQKSAVVYIPPPIYRTWWDSAAACLHIHAPYDSTVIWYVGTALPRDVQDCTRPNTIGCAMQVHHAVLLLPGVETSRRVVTHELLHLWIGHGGHPGRYFTDRCGTK